MLLIVLLFLALLSWPTEAAEQACTTQGANCWCSEPLNATGHTYVAPAINPNDSTTQQCNSEGIAGAAATRNSNDVTWATSATHPSIFSALPAGHSLTRVMKGADNHTGIFWVGGQLNSSFGVKQAAIRLYIYRSSNFEFASENLCQNHKSMETAGGSSSFISTQSAVSSTGTGGGSHQIHGGFVTGWNHSVDCCFGGPNTTNNFGPTPANISYRNKWYRLEAVYTNRAGGASPNGFQVQIYQKNVTDNLAEVKVIDLTGTVGSGPNGPWTPFTDWTPISRQDFMAFAAYRQGTCAGYYAFSHLMLAGWTTTGNRIGAASEIESGAPTPTAPSNLRVQQAKLLNRLLRPTTYGAKNGQ